MKVHILVEKRNKETKETDLTIITLKNIVSGGIYNDLGFMLKEKLIFLIEAQSTYK